MGERGEDRRAKSQRSLRATERPDLKKKKKTPLGNLRKRANMIKLCVRSSLALVWGTDWRKQQWEQWEGRLGSNCRGPGKRHPPPRTRVLARAMGKRKTLFWRQNQQAVSTNGIGYKGKRWRMIPHVLTAMSAWTEVCVLSQGKLKKRFRQRSKSVFGRKVV